MFVSVLVGSNTGQSVAILSLKSLFDGIHTHVGIVGETKVVFGKTSFEWFSLKFRRTVIKPTKSAYERFVTVLCIFFENNFLQEQKCGFKGIDPLKHGSYNTSLIQSSNCFTY